MKSGVLNGKIDFEPEEEATPVAKLSIRVAFVQFLAETKATKSPTTERYLRTLRIDSDPVATADATSVHNSARRSN